MRLIYQRRLHPMLHCRLHPMLHSRLGTWLGEIKRVDCLVPPVAFIHPVVSVVVLGVLKLSIRLRVANLDVESFPRAVLLQLADFLVGDPGPLSHNFLQSGAVAHSVAQQLRQAGLGEESLLYVVITVHPQGQLLDVGQTVGRNQGGDPGIIERHPTRDHLIGPVGDGDGLQQVGVAHQDLHHLG